MRTPGRFCSPFWVSPCRRGSRRRSLHVSPFPMRIPASSSTPLSSTACPLYVSSLHLHPPVSPYVQLIHSRGPILPAHSLDAIPEQRRGSRHTTFAAHSCPRLALRRRRPSQLLLAESPPSGPSRYSTPPAYLAFWFLSPMSRAQRCAHRAAHASHRNCTCKTRRRVHQSRAQRNSIAGNQQRRQTTHAPLAPSEPAATLRRSSYLCIPYL